MFGIGVPELILILIIGLVVFGPGKLPDVGRAIGKSLNEFKKATSGIMNDEPTKAEPAYKRSEPTEAESVKEAPGEASKPAPSKEGEQKQNIK